MNKMNNKTNTWPIFTQRCLINGYTRLSTMHSIRKRESTVTNENRQGADSGSKNNFGFFDDSWRQGEEDSGNHVEKSLNYRDDSLNQSNDSLNNTWPIFIRKRKSTVTNENRQGADSGSKINCGFFDHSLRQREEDSWNHDEKSLNYRDNSLNQNNDSLNNTWPIFIRKRKSTVTNENRQGGDSGSKRNCGFFDDSLRQGEEDSWNHDEKSLNYREDSLNQNNDSLNNSVDSWNHDENSTALQQPTKLVISNLDYKISTQDIFDLFNAFGRMQTAFIKCNESGRSLGKAEVVFEHRNDAITAMKQYNGKNFDGRQIHIREILRAKLLKKTPKNMGGWFRKVKKGQKTRKQFQDVKLVGSLENLNQPQSGDFLKSPTSLEVDQSDFINQFMKKGAKKELDLNNLRDELTRFHQKKSNRNELLFLIKSQNEIFPLISKHFPNLLEKVVIPVEDENDDEENYSDILGENPRNLKSSRVKPQMNSEILKDPQILGSAEALGDMSRMTIDKQEEYKRLLEIVTNKEKAKTAQVSTQSSLNPLAPIFLPRENQSLT